MAMGTTTTPTRVRMRQRHMVPAGNREAVGTSSISSSMTDSHNMNLLGTTGRAPTRQHTQTRRTRIRASRGEKQMDSLDSTTIEERRVTMPRRRPQETVRKATMGAVQASQCRV